MNILKLWLFQDITLTLEMCLGIVKAKKNHFIPWFMLLDLYMAAQISFSGSIKSLIFAF